MFVVILSHWVLSSLVQHLITNTFSPNVCHAFYHNNFSHTHTSNSSNSVGSSFKIYPESKSFLPLPQPAPGPLPWPPHCSPCFTPSWTASVAREILPSCLSGAVTGGVTSWCLGAAGRRQVGVSLGETAAFSRGLPRGCLLSSPQESGSWCGQTEGGVRARWGVCCGSVSCIAPRDLALGSLEPPWLRMWAREGVCPCIPHACPQKAKGCSGLEQRHWS